MCVTEEFGTTKTPVNFDEDVATGRQVWTGFADSKQNRNTSFDSVCRKTEQKADG